MRVLNGETPSNKTEILFHYSLGGQAAQFFYATERTGNLRRRVRCVSMKKEPSAAEKMLGGFAPKLVELTDNVLFGDVWERSELSQRDRSLATAAVLRTFALTGVSELDLVRCYRSSS